MIPLAAPAASGAVAPSACGARGQKWFKCHLRPGRSQPPGRGASATEKRTATPPGLSTRAEKCETIMFQKCQRFAEMRVRLLSCARLPLARPDSGRAGFLHGRLRHEVGVAHEVDPVRGHLRRRARLSTGPRREKGGVPGTLRDSARREREGVLNDLGQTGYHTTKPNQIGTQKPKWEKRLEGALPTSTSTFPDVNFRVWTQ
jgi:hypothetical protein